MPYHETDREDLRIVWEHLNTIFMPQSTEEHMTLIKLQAEYIDELEMEVERLGGLEQSVMRALKQVKELDREIVGDYIEPNTP